MRIFFILVMFENLRHFNKNVVKIKFIFHKNKVYFLHSMKQTFINIWFETLMLDKISK